MTSATVFAWVLIAGVAAIGLAVLTGLIALIRRPVDLDDVEA